ncbi:MAG: hypothetical protein H0V07_11000 [Propionibacteriales bacterium]|nr:hypothetical protein [Propionibacteriales bacterium]
MLTSEPFLLAELEYRRERITAQFAAAKAARSRRDAARLERRERAARRLAGSRPRHRIAALTR